MRKVEKTTKGDGVYTDSESSDEEEMETLAHKDVFYTNRNNIAIVDENRPKHSQTSPNSSVVAKNAKSIETQRRTPMLKTTFNSGHPSKKYLNLFGFKPDAEASDVENFLPKNQGYRIKNIYLHDLNGYCRGACYVEFETAENVFRAIRDKHMKYYGKTYIKMREVKVNALNRLEKLVKSNESYAQLGFLVIYGFDKKPTKKEVSWLLKDACPEEIYFGKYFVKEANSLLNALYIKLSQKLDESRVFIHARFNNKLSEKQVKVNRISGAAFYRDTTGLENLIESKKSANAGKKTVVESQNKYDREKSEETTKNNTSDSNIVAEKENDTKEDAIAKENIDIKENTDFVENFVEPKQDINFWKNMVTRTLESLDEINIAEDDNLVAYNLIQSVKVWMKMFEEQFFQYDLFCTYLQEKIQTHKGKNGDKECVDKSKKDGVKLSVNVKKRFDEKLLDVNFWLNMIKRATDDLETIQGFIQKNEYISITHLNITKNYMLMFGEKFKKDEEYRLNLIEEFRRVRMENHE